MCVNVISISHCARSATDIRFPQIWSLVNYIVDQFLLYLLFERRYLCTFTIQHRHSFERENGKLSPA